ncbi:hypothetical protein LSAT2_010206 [Lamellibrachia satsuma]|nr:hypothetical protein LSAT2_010206 [Lamellibrachia satsuma]
MSPYKYKGGVIQCSPKYKGHVCEEESFINRTVLRRTSYACRVLEHVRCRSWFSSGICTKHSTKLCYRNVSVVIPGVATELVCCPGWTQDDNGSCTRPFCLGGCENGGVCGVDPNNGNATRCLCPNGLTGHRCETDIDECAKSNDTCSHTCGNTFGSYFCACFEGTILATDGVTCLTNNSAENDNGTLPVAPLQDQLTNDYTTVIIGSLLGGAAVVTLVLLCVVIAVMRVRRKRASLEDRVDAPRNSTQNNYYIGLSDFDRTDDSVLVLAGTTGVQESSTDDSPALGRTDALRTRTDVTNASGGNEYVIDGEYASHWYEDADAVGAECCARTDNNPCPLGKAKSNQAGTSTYDYAYGVSPALKRADAENPKPGSDHYECVATRSPYDYAYGATVDRQATRKVRLPESTDGYLTPVCVCPSHPGESDAVEVPSEYIHCGDDTAGGQEASIYENGVLAHNANHRTTQGEEHRPDTAGNDVYLTTGQCRCSRCRRGLPECASRCANIAAATRQMVVARRNSRPDESIYCNTRPDTHVTRTEDTTGDTQMGSSCSTLSKTDDTGLDDSDYVSGDVNRDSADYENCDFPMRDDIVYENCAI